MNHNNQITVEEKLSGIIERVTFHNEQNGWSVLKVSPFQERESLVTVLVHQMKIFAGCTMEFIGAWINHPKHGKQFKASIAIEKKPSTIASLEKYLGSGLIAGVGPATAKKIVKYFKNETLNVFENNIEDLLKVPGIAEKKLETITKSWLEHKSIRDVMIFLQTYGISTLYAIKIYKAYGDKAIMLVSENPYRLASDIYGIGFFSADKIALSLGFAKEGIPRMEAGVGHILAASREDGHCYLLKDQVMDQLSELLNIKVSHELLDQVILSLVKSNRIVEKEMEQDGERLVHLYSNRIFFDERAVAKIVSDKLKIKLLYDEAKMKNWVIKYCSKFKITLSSEQENAVTKIPLYAFSILTGGPGCGKTTSTRVLVKLLKAMGLSVVLVAPTGRAAQRMSDVMGEKAQTIHRLLGWDPQKNGFKKDESDKLHVDFLIVDETSMIDISLAASLLKATPDKAQVLFIGDPDQLPAVGAGNVLTDLLGNHKIKSFRLTQIFRQDKESLITKFAHEINRGVLPRITSPMTLTKAFNNESTNLIDCLFIDTEEATQDQLRFIKNAKAAVDLFLKEETKTSGLVTIGEKGSGRILKTSEGIEFDELLSPPLLDEESNGELVLKIPEKYKNINLKDLIHAKDEQEELKAILKKVHPWSTLNFGLSATDSLLRIYTKSIFEWMQNKNIEIQILSPQVRGSMGTAKLNEVIQEKVNGSHPHKCQITLGTKILREGDRVIQTRNNYDLGVFNGEIGKISKIDLVNFICLIEFEGAEKKTVSYNRENLTDLSLAYAITIHKSQGSEFHVVIIPVFSQHFNMLYRNLIYTGLTRAKKMAIFIGNRKALHMAIKRIDNKKRQTNLCRLIH